MDDNLEELGDFNFDDGEEITLDSLGSEMDLLDDADHGETEESNQESNEAVEEESPEDTSEEAPEEKVEEVSEEKSEDEKGIDELDVDDILNYEEKKDEESPEKNEVGEFETDKNPFYTQSKELTENNQALTTENSNLKLHLEQATVQIKEAGLQLTAMNEMQNMIKDGRIGELKAYIQMSTGVDLDQHQTTQFSSNQSLIDHINNRKVEMQLSDNQAKATAEASNVEIRGFIGNLKTKYTDLTDSTVNELVAEMQTNAYNNPEILYVYKNHEKLIKEAERRGVIKAQTMYKSRKKNSYKSSASGQGQGANQKNIPSGNFDDMSDVVTLTELQELDY